MNVLVPNSYSAGDEGKVVSNGALVAQSSQNIDTNGTYDTTLKDEIVVNVSGGGGLPANIVTGTFSGTEYGSMDVSIPYNGTGFPIYVYIYAVPYPAAINDGDIAVLSVAKSYYKPFDADVTNSKYFGGTKMEWNSNSSAYVSTLISNSSGMYGITPSSPLYCAFQDNTTLRVRIAGNGTSKKGFVPNVTYNYLIVYSS